ncbi:MAG: alpha-galactosidase [Eubacterium sp.]|nr:alpha-galactosidase [Eubacterium sp.]
MIRRSKHVFVLSTPGTTYMFQVLPSGHLEHLYYGTSLGDFRGKSDDEILQDAACLEEKRAFPAGNMISYDQKHPELTLEDLCLEMSSYGKGDIREPFIEVAHADGSVTSDFLFENAVISADKPAYETLPGSYFGSDDGEKKELEYICSSRFSHLAVTLRDASYNLRLELHYYVYEDCDVITRCSRFVNDSTDQVRLNRLMSTQLDFADGGYQMRMFHGAWGREMYWSDLPVRAGKVVNASIAGVSSNRSNPFVMLHREDTTENAGLCYGLNLIYSGNHYEAVEVNSFGKTRFVSGINPQSFSFLLLPGDTFEAPEAVMTCSDAGYTGMSLSMHHFVREHIVRGFWKDRERPVLLNSWEAAYFKINRSRLLHLAKAGRDVGIELFVMDDGWFGKRDNDKSSLGDWDVNTEKLPGGLEQISRDVQGLGMKFGLWVEPEMVSQNSRLYQEHPDWAMQIPGKPHAEGRNQMFLDLANPEVVDYLTEKMKEVFSSGEISYVKWDMNRIMSDVYSPCLPAERQEETAHRYICGFYRLAHALTAMFPEILFEGCAAGGCRFDLGALCYFPQIWASDDTDPVMRSRIQQGYSYGYPLSVMTAHVSASPNHQTLRSTPLDTRFHIAAYGDLGYELNLNDLDRRELDEIRRQIALYKEWRHVFQYGDFYRGRFDNLVEWTVVSRDRKRAVGMIFQNLTEANQPYTMYRARGLDPDKRYHFYNIAKRHDIRDFGDLINTASPVHVRQGSVLQNMIARFVTMPGEQEEIVTSGEILMKAGVKLQGAYSGTGYNEHTRYFADFNSRLYFMEEEDYV